MKKIIPVFLWTIIFSLLNPSFSYAQGACGGIQIDFSCLESVFSKILNIALSGAAIATFVMILMGGFSWLSSGGDPKAMEKARDQLTYGITGLFLMIASWFILKFIKDFTWVDVTSFKIGI